MKRAKNIIPIASVCAASAAMIFRAFQLLVTVDYNEMGFYSSEAGFLSTYGFYLFLLLAAAVFIVGVFIDEKNAETAFKSDKNALTPKQTAAFGLGFLAAACLKFYMLVFSFKGFGIDFMGEAVIFLVFAAIGFTLLGSKKIKPFVGYLMLLISISYTLKAAALFMGDTIITRVSDELLLLLSYVSAVFFFLSLGRYFSGNESKGTRKKLLFFASASACLSASASLAGYIALIIDGAYMKERMTLHPVSEIGIIVLAFIVVFTLYGKKTELKERDGDNKEDADDENEKTSSV